MSKNNRRKGHAYERDLAKVFRKLGFDKTRTSREASRLYDNSKYDLWGLPYLVQAKAGYKKTRLKPDVLFRQMKEGYDNFPKEERALIESYPMLLFNKLDGYKEEHHLVTLKYKDFIKMLIELNVYKRILSPVEAEVLNGELL
jgi:hypothetical protein